MRTAEELRQQAALAVRRGSFASARTLLQRARRLAREDVDLLALVELTEAYMVAEQEDSAEGIRRCRALLDREALAETTRGRVWSQLGLLQLRSGEAEAALQSFSEAVARLEDAPEPLGRALLNRGNLHLQLHRPEPAARDLVRAASELGAAGLTESRARAQHNLGYARMLAGDLVEALRLIDAAGAVLLPLSPVSRAQSEQDRAEVLLAAGRPREAVRALEAAAAAYGTRRLRRYQAECELVLARTLLWEDPAHARAVARRSARRFRSNGSEAWAVRADAVAVIAAIATGDASPGLLQEADRLVDRLRAAGHLRDADRLTLHAARLSLRRGDDADAGDRVAGVRLDRRTPVDARLLVREVRAELARTRGQPGRARQQARAGLADLHGWQASFGSLDLQSTLVGHGNSLARLGLRLALDDGRPELVLEWSERARALASRVTPIRLPRDPQLAADLAELRALGDDGSRSRRDELQERIRRQSWYGEGGGHVPEPASYDELRGALARHDAALVAHIALEGRLTALVVTERAAVVVPLGAAAAARSLLDRVAVDLDLAASRSDGPLGPAVLGSLHADLARAADLLVAPVLPAVGDRRLVLTPSALLAGTPWTLLPGLVGRPLTVPPSATRWLGSVGRRPADHAQVGLVAGPGAPRAEEEVRRAAREWPTAVLLVGEKATAGQVGDLAEGVDVLHVAGHGHHAHENPLFSSIDLADGRWYGYDVDTLARTPDVVVLSACELGRASVRSAEETLGMTAAWLHAGARTALSSPALVADEVACEALARWHRLVAAGAAPADALAEVGAGAGAGPDGPHRAPLPFVCFGAGW
ncbi:MAG TPA: CHAT domain-containing protein [Marmoricola sp.]|nr:CHAT domain-containing protein [Marmoricola sp.]